MWKKFDLESTTVKAGDLDIARVKINGYLDSSTFPKLQDHLSKEIEAKKYNYLLDFQDLDYISSAGLGVLMGMLRQVRENNGDIKIINMSEKIQRVFNLLGFSRLMQIYKSEQEALDTFAHGAAAEEGPENTPEQKPEIQEDY